MTSIHEEVGKRQAFDDPKEAAFVGLLRTSALLALQMDRLFKEYGLSIAAYNVLRILRGHADAGIDAVRCAVIREQMVTAVPDLTRLIDRLCRDGLASRERSSEDGRVVLVSITAAGRRRLGRADGPAHELLGDMLGHVSEADLAHLGGVLDRIRGKELAHNSFIDNM